MRMSIFLPLIDALTSLPQTPEDFCWPSVSTWNSFNTTVGGRLIKSVPPAISCYPGPAQDLTKCAKLVTDLTNSTVVGNDPIALDYNSLDKCPPVNFAAGEKAGTCELEDVPLYTVDARTPSDVQKTVDFARTRGIRLVIRNTGHDLSGRSTGGASLQVWIRYMKNGLTFSAKNPSTCTKGAYWSGATFTVAGGYVWGEAYKAAAEKGHIVVGGGDPTVGIIGGWMQGGGHSPANYDFGLGADQVVEAQVVLASGKLVTANACQNQDVFWAIRGGGPSTYGAVVSTTIKAHPTAPYTAHKFALAPLAGTDLATFREAVAILYESQTELVDAGWNGYGNWNQASYQPVVASYFSGYNHALAARDQTEAQMKATWAKVEAKLAPIADKLYISSKFYTYKTFVEYYDAQAVGQQAVGSRGGSSVGSWTLDEGALANSTGVRNMVNIIAGKQYDFSILNFWLGGGKKSQVAKDVADPYSGVNPAWREAVSLNIVARGWAAGTAEATQKATQDDVTFNYVGSMKDMNPNGGAYMNEGDYRSPTHMADFYGKNLNKLSLVKIARDPLGVFYCPTCVGSDNWYEDDEGRLCLDFGIYDY